MGREAILKAVKENKPDLLPLPEIDLAIFAEEMDLLETFKSNVKLVGGTIIELNQKDLDVQIKELYPNATKIVALDSSSKLGTISITKDTDPHSMETIDLAIVKGEFGVAENGSVWITDEQTLLRVLPFITNDLVLVLSKKDVCENMHTAYKKIADRNRTFGLFLSGPSKTADIEQCLVIGAQGAMSLTVVLV